jgi:CRP-like cAMP-binding protein
VAFWQKHTGSVEYLAGLSFFDGFAPEELRRVAALGHEVEFPSGAVMIDQGSVGQVCYVLVAGSASVYIAGEHVATLEAGSLVGEMALVDHRPRRATVVASTPLKALSFDTKAFRTLLDEMPKASDRVMRMLYTRLEVNEAGQRRPGQGSS